MTGVFRALAGSSACVTLEWAVVCSQQWSRTAGAGGATPAEGGSAVLNPA
jgi:hypothetical protein